MKYPKKYKGEKVFILVPFKNEQGFYRCAQLKKDGSYVIDGLADHHTPESCQVCCSAFNKRVGYSYKKVKKIIKAYEQKVKENKTRNKT